MAQNIFTRSHHAAKSKNNSSELTRRRLLTTAATAAGLTMTRLANAQEKYGVVRGRIQQSVVPWCFKPMKIEELVKASKALGLKSVELVDPKHWPLLKKHGLVCAIAGSHRFTHGLNHREHHAECIEKLTKSIDSCAEAGWNNVITFSGMRGNLTDEQGKTNMVEGLKKVVSLAEKKRVNICIEPLNSRVDFEMKGHPGYQCDTVEWAVDVCDRIGSSRVKILFDIYHVQIMQGDVITRIKQYKDYIAHYHTAGVPGRNELDDEQEINYPAIMKAIVETGYLGYVGQEFIPKHPEMIASLRQAVELCDV